MPSMPLFFSTAWTLRDSFLEQSTRGKDYIAYYYMLGTIVDLYQPSDSGLVSQLLFEIQAAMDVVLTGQDQDIVLPQATAASAITFINTLRGRTSNRIVLGALSVAESDVMLYTDMPRTDFLALFNAE